ncbi:isopentenyl-diphosphate Delta-isomerase [Psychrobium sp. 1_MG-2023]|uniref:isopentenyl-diphosphate Delta-isomerase n=1 Tax=Psychrobium sp. 1_MG-2023 TaxID=3062624 RepID=UPI000C348E7D|nr:isopentenyl-diphosphate Delta-isomerase [Psychrobium sp. 1_MG-2023]MDP2562879.1 isopentenyl-diphosphate Delta-isomerase [Psychrobium sp. 1_MG-2023]PKF57145.1 isopentenyl-diphosphate delta-isomerase [Alteromonadales bacterium alter-6D02]
MNRNQVVLVDRNDNVIGSTDKLLAHQQGLLHRAFSIFIVREHQGHVQLLLQQRALHKYHCGGLWSNSCCSHPQPNESVTESALARLTEELGFSLSDLRWVGSHTYRAELTNELIEHEYDHLFVSWANPNLDNLNPDEVAAVAWVDIEQLEQLLTTKPHSFTPWFAPTFEKVKSSLIRRSIA